MFHVRNRLGALLMSVALLATACGGGSEAATDVVEPESVDGSSQVADSAAESEEAVEAAEPRAEVAEPTATPVPPTPTPEPTPNPDRDGDGVLDDDDDFPDDPERSVGLVSAFPLIDGVNQLPEDEPSVQALRVVQSLVLADETDRSLIDEHFAPEFINSIGYDGIDGVLRGVRIDAAGVWEVIDVRAVTRWWLWVQMGDPVNTAKDTALVLINLNPNTNQVVEMNINAWRRGIQTQQYAEDRTKDLDAIFAELSTQTESVGLLLAEVTADGCATIKGHEETVPLATGSMFKQWVLGAAATEIEAGRRSPDDIITFAPGQFMVGGSLDSGRFEGSVDLTLQETANLMMNRSDNGATDMVERHIGRQAAWDFVETAGLADPAVLNPIIGVRDYDHLFSSVSPAQLDQYLDGTEPEQEAFLLEVLEPLGATRTGQYGNPGAQYYSWRASPLDVCNGMAALRNQFAFDSEPGRFIDEAYSGEIGLFGVRNNWDRAWTKGGGIPGFTPGTNVVFTNTALVESNDGRAYVIVTMFNADEGFAMDQIPFEVASLVSRLHELLITDAL